MQGLQVNVLGSSLYTINKSQIDADPLSPEGLPVVLIARGIRLYQTAPLNRGMHDQLCSCFHLHEVLLISIMLPNSQYLDCFARVRGT